jgi:nicotinate-nucleotide adenylyltransferase
MVVGVYGGSFNPPHVGHAMVAGWLGWTRRVDEVWLVPAFRHAFDKPLAPWERRLAACEALARAVGPHVRVSTVEAELPTPSFTIQTLDALAARFPADTFRLVVGSDVLPQTRQWRAWDQIQRRFTPLAVGRVGFADVPGAPTFPPVSSTEIRRRLAAGEAVDHLVPAAVLEVWTAP